MNSKYWHFLFFGDLLAELIATGAGFNNARYITKPLLIIILFSWFTISSLQFSPLRYYIAAALFFSWAGDIFLLMNGAAWFMAGLGSFLAAHILYIFFFLKVRYQQTVRQPWRGWIIFLIAAYTIALYAFLYPYAGKLQVPVGIYALTIGVMLVAAVQACSKHLQKAGAYCTAGAVLFVLSDSLLALNKFYHSFPAANVLIMLTYGLAQFALIKGSLLYLAAENKSLTK